MSGDGHPGVSIVIPVYNGEAYLREAVDSALAQTVPALEVVVVNDGSEDGTEAVALSYGDRIRYFRKDNGGVATALNLAVREARGEYVSWLSHDDVYDPRKLELELAALSKAGDPRTVVYSSFSYINERSVTVGTERLSDKHDRAMLDTAMYPLFNGLVHGCTVLVRRDLLLEHGLFREDLRTTQDYDLWFRILRSVPIKYVDEALVLSRVHAGQTSRSMSRLHREESADLWNGVLRGLGEEDLGGLGADRLDVLYGMLQRMLANDLPGPAREALRRAWDVRDHRPGVMLATATMTGGVGRFVADLSAGLAADFAVHVLYVNGRTVRLTYGRRVLLDLQLDAPILLDDMYREEELSGLVAMIVFAFGIRLVHATGFICMGFGFLEALKRSGVGVVYTVNDFHLLCASQFFLDGDSKYCDMNQDLERCDRCLASNPYTVWLGVHSAAQLVRYRGFVRTRVLPALDRIVYPCAFTREAYERYYPESSALPGVIIEHGIDGLGDAPPLPAAAPAGARRLRVAIVGDIAAHKGLSSLVAITEAVPPGSFEFILFGRCEVALRNTEVIPLPAYDRTVSTIRNRAPDVALILSECPEAFSYVLSECWEAGVPVIVSDRGALQERVERLGAGLVVEAGDVAAILSLLGRLRDEPALMAKLKDEAAGLRLPSRLDMSRAYADLYRDVIDGSGPPVGVGPTIDQSLVVREAAVAELHRRQEATKRLSEALRPKPEEPLLRLVATRLKRKAGRVLRALLGRVRRGT